MRKKTKHTITAEDINECLKVIKVELAGSYGDGSHKKLELTVQVFDTMTDVCYRVYNQKECVCAVNSKYIAIEKYNELP